jgi:hypothetical protein
MSSLIAILWLSTPVQSFAGIFFQDGFESGNMSHTQNGAAWIDHASTTVNTTKPNGGKYSLEFNYPGVPDGQDGWAEQRFTLGGKYPDIWASYDLFVPTNYYHRIQNTIGYGSNNNKSFIHFWEGAYSNPAGPLLGIENWPLSDGSSSGSVRIFKPNYFDSHNHACAHTINLSDRGQWIKITMHFKYASSANNDGVAQIWKTYKNGITDLACDISNGKWYVAGAAGFDTGYLLGWANSGFATNTKFYIDNVVFSDTPLLPNVQAPPNPPAGIQ